MPHLTLLQYWKLPKSPRLDEIRHRLSDAFAGKTTPSLAFDRPLDVHDAARRLYGLDPLPYREELEAQLGCSLLWVRVRLGQKRALHFLRVDWFVHGECILFRSLHPSRSIVETAVIDVLIRRKQLEK